MDGYPGDLLFGTAPKWNTASWVLTRGTVMHPERTWILRARRRGYPECTWGWFLPSGGSTRVLRVNMIRTRGGEVEVTEEEPRFGGSQAAPLQGADCGRPSRSANERSANDDTDESEAEGRPRACRRRRRLPEVPYSTASSEERYHGTDGGSRSRAKTPETNSKTNTKTSTGRRVDL